MNTNDLEKGRLIYLCSKSSVMMMLLALNASDYDVGEEYGRHNDDNGLECEDDLQ